MSNLCEFRSVTRPQSTHTMAPATEIAVIFLKPDATIEDASSPAGQQFAKCRDVLKVQKGYQRQYWGRQMEDPKLLIWTIDWFVTEGSTSVTRIHN